MKLLNERNQTRDVAERWRLQFPDSKFEIHRKLKELDTEIATAKDVADIIGNSSWVQKEKCDECGKETWDIVELGRESQYTSEHAYICIDCLKKAIELVDKK